MTIDVTDIVQDEIFQTSQFTVIRRPEVVTTGGLSSVPNPVIYSNVAGSITPAGMSAIQRQPDLDMSTKPISVITTFRLYQAVPGYKPDQIIYKDTTYEVTDLEDWSDWGAGFVRATCVVIDALPQPPQ